MTNTKKFFAAILLLVGFQAQALDIEKALRPTIILAQKWAADPKIVKAVNEANATNATKYKEMTQEAWKDLSIMGSVVKDFTKNEAATLLNANKTEGVTEAFLNAKDGTKVAFLAKTSGWSHLGKPKHDVPMTGKVWVGKIETDESTGFQQVQFAVPVFDGRKVIGSLVIGYEAGKLK